MELTFGADASQRIITLLTNIEATLIDIGGKMDALTLRVEVLEAKVDKLTDRVIALETKVDKLTERVDALETRMTSVETKVDILTEGVDALETNLNNFRNEVREEFKVMGERVTVVEKNVAMIESRQIDIEQRFTAMESQMDSRFYALESLIDKNVEPPGARKNIPRQAPKGRD